MNQAENEGKPSEKILSKEKAAVYMNTIKEKSSIYCRTACTKTTELWNSGTKGKAICIGTAFCVLLIGWLVFRDSSKPESGNVEKTDDMETTLQTLANAHRQSELPPKASGDDAVPNANAIPQPYVQDVSNDESEVAKVGAMALALIAALPVVLTLTVFKDNPSLALGGTGLIIVVGVALEINSQIDGLLAGKSFDEVVASGGR